MPRNLSPLAIGVFVVLASIAVLGCDEDAPSSPECATGQILGTITGAGMPLQAKVAAEHVRDPSGPLYPWVRFDTKTDSTGSYVLQVVPGRYVVKALIEDIWCCVSGNISAGALSRTDADTFIVRENGDPVRADVPLGAALVRVGVPAELDGREVQGLLKPEAGWDVVYTFATAHAGSVELAYPALNPGRYKMRFNAADTGIWLPGSYSEAGGDWITVEAGEEATYDAQIPARGVVRGSVTGSWQRLNFQRPMLRLFDAESTLVASNTATWEGLYELWVLAPVQARLVIGIGGTWRWHGGNGFEDAARLDLQPGEAMEISIVESGIAGGVGRSGPSTEIGLYDAAGARLATASLFGDRGEFRFANLLPGTYLVHIGRGPSWIAHWYDQVDAFERATPIHLGGDGQVVWISPTLMEGGSILGRVLDPEGRPIIGAIVDLTSATDPMPWPDRQTHTGDGGEFEVPALPNGLFKVSATTAARGTIWYPGVAAWDSAGVIAIERYAEVGGIDLQFR